MGVKRDLGDVMDNWIHLNGIMYLNSKLVAEYGQHEDNERDTYACAMHVVDDYARKLLAEMGQSLDAIL